MTIALLIVLFVVVVLCICVVVARLYPGSFLDLVGLDPRTRARQRIAAEAQDMTDLLELENRRRRAAGLAEVTEDELRHPTGP